MHQQTRARAIINTTMKTPRRRTRRIETPPRARRGSDGVCNESDASTVLDVEDSVGKQWATGLVNEYRSHGYFLSFEGSNEPAEEGSGSVTEREDEFSGKKKHKERH